MELLSMDRDEALRGWRAEVKTESSGRPAYCFFLRWDDSPEWLMTHIDDIRIGETIRADLPVFTFLEEARLAREAGRQPGVTNRERREIIG